MNPQKLRALTVALEAGADLKLKSNDSCGRIHNRDSMFDTHIVGTPFEIAAGRNDVDCVRLIWKEMTQREGEKPAEEPDAEPKMQQSRL